MNDPRFQQILRKIVANEATPDEERELAEYLEDPGRLAAVEAQLAPLREKIGALLELHRALKFDLRALPAPSRREEFDEFISELRENQRTAAGKSRFRFPRALWIWGPALAAGWALWVFVIRPPVSPQVELALVSSAATLRGALDQSEVDLGVPFSLRRFENLQERQAWISSPLAPQIRARVWVDDEKMVVLAITRDSSGQVRQLERRLSAEVAVREQLRRFTADLLRPSSD